MDDYVTKIKEEPAGVYRTLGVVGQDAFLFESVFNFVVDSPNLAFAFATAYHEVISKAADIARIQ